MKSTMKNMVLSLTLIAAAMGAMLALLRQATAEPIAMAQANARAEAIASVLPQAPGLSTGDPVEITAQGDSRPVTLFPAYADGKLAGAAVESWTLDGFSGEIDVMVGFDSQGRITGYSVLSHAETPGLGAKAQEWFRDVPGRSIIGSGAPLALKGQGGDIDAITAATITSRAFLGAVNRARRAFMQWQGKPVEPDAATGATGHQQQHDAATGATGHQQQHDAATGAAGHQQQHDIATGATGHK